MTEQVVYYLNNKDGLINLKLSRKIGRLGETQYPDPEVEGYNPCAEQSLASYETCCLAEIFLPNVSSEEELKDIATLLYRINKHSLALPAHHPETDAIVHKNMRMGIGLTGVLQSNKEQLSWMSDTYEHLRDYDGRYSQLHGFNKSIKLTTIKPSGTLSLLPGVTPGIHPGYAQYMFRRIRIAASHSLVAVCKAHGYPVEYVKNFDGTEDYNTVVVTFPFAYPEGTKLAADMTAIDQLKEVRKMQEQWSDNSVSCTVYYRKEELPEIKEYLAKYYKNNHKSLSFLLHSDHGFAQAPFEEITKEQYEALLKATTPITSVAAAVFEGGDECASGACPVR
jgi:ribonucleoside-triphosphate reductase